MNFSILEEFIRFLTEPEDKTPGPIIRIMNGQFMGRTLFRQRSFCIQNMVCPFG